MGIIAIFANAYFSVPSKLTFFISVVSLSIATIVLTIVAIFLIALQVARERKNPVIKYFRQGSDIQNESLLYRHALDASKQQLIFNHPDTSDDLDEMDNLASLHFHQGRYAEAEPLYIQALDICKRRFGPDHLLTATYLNKLANVYVCQDKFIVYTRRDGSRKGKVSRAQPLYERALRIRKQQLDSNHLDIASTLNGLATMYFRQRMYAKAQRYYQQVLVISKQQLGPNHSEFQHIQEQYVAAAKLKYLKVLFYIVPLPATYIGFFLFSLKLFSLKIDLGILVWLALAAATLLFRECQIRSVIDLLGIGKSEKDSPLK